MQVTYNKYGQPVFSGTQMFNGSVGMFVAALLAFAIAVRWMMPTIIAFARHHPQRWNIFGLNLFLGLNGWGRTALLARAWEVI